MNKKAFSRIDLLISIYIIVLLLPILFAAFKLAIKINLFDNEIQEETALIQLRRKILFGHNYDADSQLFSFEFENKNWRIYQVNNNLILTPGTQIIINDINQATFLEKDACYYLQYKKRNLVKERIIACE